LFFSKLTFTFTFTYFVLQFNFTPLYFIVFFITFLYDLIFTIFKQLTC
jgi:hypothetical protein